MRAASTYRGARRNAAKRDGKIVEWRKSSAAANAANFAAKIDERYRQCFAAREAVTLALVEAKFGHPAVIANNAYLTFYRSQPRTRVVNRIIRDLTKQSRAA